MMTLRSARALPPRRGLAFLLLVGVASAAGAGVVGDLRIHELESRVFGNTRKLRVLLPEGYDAPENAGRRYPVLYLNDGQNLFDASTSALHPLEWRVDETVRELVAAGRIPPLVVVGIDSAGRRGRFHEYFPWADQYLHPPDLDPRGSAYPEFLLGEVVPFVEARYRVRRDPAGRGLGGSSAGALAAIYAVIHRPGQFGKLLVESPSLYVDDAHILREAAGVTSWPGRIYLGVGTNEDFRTRCDPAVRGKSDLERDLARFDRLLRMAGVGKERIHETVTPCAVHDEAAWAARFPEALGFLYAPE